MLDYVNFLPEVPLFFYNSCDIKFFLSFFLALAQNLEVSIMPFGFAAVEANWCAAGGEKIEFNPHAE